MSCGFTSRMDHYARSLSLLTTDLTAQILGIIQFSMPNLPFELRTPRNLHQINAMDGKGPMPKSLGMHLATMYARAESDHAAS